MPKYNPTTTQRKNTGEYNNRTNDTELAKVNKYLNAQHQAIYNRPMSKSYAGGPLPTEFLQKIEKKAKEDNMWGLIFLAMQVGQAISGTSQAISNTCPAIPEKKEPSSSSAGLVHASEQPNTNPLELKTEKINPANLKTSTENSRIAVAPKKVNSYLELLERNLDPKTISASTRAKINNFFQNLPKKTKQAVQDVLNNHEEDNPGVPFIVYLSERENNILTILTSTNNKTYNILEFNEKALVYMISDKQLLESKIHHEILHYIMHKNGIGGPITILTGDEDTKEICKTQYLAYHNIIELLSNPDSVVNDPNISALVDVFIKEKSYLVSKFETAYFKDSNSKIEITKNSPLEMKWNFIISMMDYQLSLMKGYKNKLGLNLICGEFLANTLDNHGSEPMSANVATVLNAMQKWYLEKTKQKLPEGQIPLGDFVVGEYKKYEERFQAKVASLNANQNAPTPPKVLENTNKASNLYKPLPQNLIQKETAVTAAASTQRRIGR
jgi:hypothetical protein